MITDPQTRPPGNEGNVPSSSQENLDILAGFYEREEARISGIRLAIERISAFFGSPAYFAFAVVFVVGWVLVNSWGSLAGWEHIDEPPFFWLQGIVSSNALLLTVAVLIRQDRMAKLAEHRAHLDLQINLLTEQKTTKILQLVDQLRRDLPASSSHEDADVAELTKPADTQALLHAIKQQHDEQR